MFSLAAIKRFITGQLTRKQLAEMTDFQISQYVNFDNRGGRYNTQFSREQARRMSHGDLMQKINDDALEGRMDTMYAEEWRERQQNIQAAQKGKADVHWANLT